MGELVNLRQARKKRNRREKERAAENNRVQFGRTKAEKKLTTKINDKAAQALDQQRLERDENPKDQP